MTQFSKDTILFRFVPDSKVDLPRAANEAKLYIDSNGKLKILYFNGDVVELGSEQTVTNNIVQENVTLYDDSLLKEQLAVITATLKTFATTTELANDIAIVSKIIDKTKAETLADIMPMIANVDMLLQKVEAANKATDAAATQARADILANQDEVAALRNIISLVSASLSRLSGDYANAITLVNRSLDLKADKVIVAGQIATLNANMPVVVAGSENVTVDKVDNMYVVSVTGTDRIIERIIEKGGGGGVSKKWVLDQIQGGSVTPPAPAALDITSFTGGGTYELGSVITAVNLAWTYNYDPDTIQSLNQGIGSLPLLDRSYMFTTPISSSTTFTLSASDSVHGSDSDNEVVSFVNRRYYGTFAADALLTNSDVVALTSELVDSRVKSFVSFACGGNRFVFAYPKRLGLAAVTDGSNNVYQDWYDGGSGSISPYEVTVTNAYGYSEVFYVYQSFNQYFGSPTFHFN
jgi:hypothetical protein